MLNFFALGVMASSIALAALALFRERSLQHAFALLEAAPPAGIAIDTSAEQPTRLEGFDPTREALLVQLPIADVADIDADDFVTRPAADGRGQELLFRNRVLLQITDVSPQRQIEVYVSPMSA